MHEKHKKAFEESKHAHGGKFKATIEHFEQRVAAESTPAGRLAAAVDASCENLQQMKASGATADDFELALRHTLDNFEHIRAAVEHGL